MKQKYTKTDLNLFLNRKNKFKVQNELLLDRISDILRIICEVYDTSDIYCVWFSGAEEGEIGYSNYNKNEKYIKYCTSDFNFPTDKYEYVTDYNTEMPISYLFMEDSKLKELLVKERDNKPIRSKKNVKSIDELDLILITAQLDELGYKVIKKS